MPKKVFVVNVKYSFFLLLFILNKIKQILDKGLCHLESNYGVYFTPKFFNLNFGKHFFYCILQY